MTYVVRQIDAIFTLGQGSFGTTGSSTLKLTGARILVQTSTVANNTSIAGGTAIVARIYGMPLDTMNQLTVAGLQYNARNNRITINAGDAGGQKTTIFSGYINEAYPDFSEGANSALVVSGITGTVVAMKPVAPLSFQSSVGASTVFQKIAGNSGMNYENNGVSTQFSAGAYFPGTAMAQIAAAAKWANCAAWIDGAANTLVTVPQNGNRSGDVTEISPATGMIGYPSYQNVSIVVRSVFNPAVKYYGLINVISDLPPANGRWRVVDLTYSLASQLSDGPWEMTIRATSPTTGMQ